MTADWKPMVHAESGLPLEFRTKGGTVLPLMVMPRFSKGSRTFSNYLQVAHRLVWMREEHPQWSIVTELAYEGPDWAVFKATISDESGRVIATSHKHESAAGFGDYREKAETGAIGRALALCGYGTQFAPEFDEEERLADSPMPPLKTAPVDPEVQQAVQRTAAALKEMDELAAAGKLAKARAKVIEAAGRAGKLASGAAGEMEITGELARTLKRDDSIVNVAAFTMEELAVLYRAFDAQAKLQKTGAK